VKTLWSAGLLCLLAAVTAAAQDAPSNAVAEKGKMLVASNGARLGNVYRVGSDGSAQIIIDGKLVTVPATTLSSVDGKLTTSLSKSEVIALH
jgi:hypothetical protein